MAMAGRKLGADGEIALHDKQEQFLDWLTGDRPEGETHEQFAERIGVTPRTLRNWKKDAPFLRRWEERMRETHAHPETLARQLAGLNEIAVNAPRHSDRIKATELYWRIVDRMSPDRVAIESGKSVENLSDAELDQILAESARGEADRRGLRAI